MIAHCKEALVVAPLLADKDRIDRRLHVVVNPAPRDTAQKLERPRMRIEDHFLALARIRNDVERAAVTQSGVRGLHLLHHAVEFNPLVAPVKLVRLTRRKHQRDERRQRLC